MISSSEAGAPLEVSKSVPELQGPALAALSGPAVQRLLRLRLRAQGRLSRGHVRLVGECLGVSERTVRRWLAQAEADPDAGGVPGARPVSRFKVMPEVRVLLVVVLLLGRDGLAH
ncbi:hypothetical protein GCM10010302_75130 [Streptomyces polychromogenes]|uniref:Transposase n=1 Tax=Streptomyces polychromogenes TaxID=67342 RepID=A0ABP3FST4_9ACTN